MATRTRITGKRQVTVPKDICEALGLQPGDEIEWLPGNGSVRVKKVAPDDDPFAKWRGYFKDLKGQDVDALVEDMRGR
jgi:AbrB family looped-hinge helix DNA binding protein